MITYKGMQKLVFVRCFQSYASKLINRRSTILHRSAAVKHSAPIFDQKGHSWPLVSFKIVESKQIYKKIVTGLEPRSSGVGSNRFATWSQPLPMQYVDLPWLLLIMLLSICNDQEIATLVGTVLKGTQQDERAY